MKIVYSSIAELEANQAALYYETQQTYLGDEFLNELEESLHFIQENPKIGTNVEKNICKWCMSKFPYLIVYEISEFSIQVIAVFHSKRNPLFWMKRI